MPLVRKLNDDLQLVSKPTTVQNRPKTRHMLIQFQDFLLLSSIEQKWIELETDVAVEGLITVEVFVDKFQKISEELGIGYKYLDK